MKESDEANVPRKFGMFYPRGYVILTFERRQEAEQVAKLLMEGGYDDEDIWIMDTDKVLASSSEDLKNLSGLIKLFGDESDVAESHNAGAALGQTFLIGYAPSDLDTKRLMNVARRVGYIKAHKYDRFTLTDL